MKFINLPYQLKLQFEGVIHPKSIALGDVDNDKLNELVVGTISGDLFIYKGSQTTNSQNELTPWKTCRLNGTITSVVIGDIKNIGRSSLLVITAEGDLYLFDSPFMSSTSSMPPTPSISVSSPHIITPLASPSPQEITQSSEKLKLIQKSFDASIQSSIILPNWTSSIPTNTIAALIGDIDGDGINELVLGRSDRQIHAYQLTEGRAISNQNSPNPKSKARGMKVFTGRVKSLDYDSLFWLNKAMFHVTEPISCLKLDFDQRGNPILIVGQLGGRYLEIDINGLISSFPKELQGIDAGVPTQLSSVLMPDNTVGVLTATSQGLINVYGLTAGDQRTQIALPSGMPVLDITTLPTLVPFAQHPLVATCLTDGTTYFVDHTYQLARFSFGQSVRGFISGQFGFQNNSPCLIYVALNGSITLVHHLNVNCCTNPKLPLLSANDLESLFTNDKYRELLEKFGYNPKWERSKKVALYHHIALYHFQSPNPPSSLTSPMPISLGRSFSQDWSEIDNH